MRVLNKEYWPYRVTIKHPTVDELNAMRPWVNERIAESEWYLLAQPNGKLDVYFKNDQILTMFLMRWSK